MRTISQAVQEIVAQSPFYLEILSDGLSNNAKLARRIKSEIEKQLLESVSEAAVAMALHRMAKDLEVPPYGTKLLSQITGIMVRSDLSHLAFSNDAEFSKRFADISRLLTEKEDAFLNFSRGLHQSVLIVSGDILEAALNLLDERKVERIDGLSAITMRLPESSLNVPGMYHPLLKAISQEGISLVEVISVRSEFSIILHDKDIERGFSAIKRVTSKV